MYVAYSPIEGTPLIEIVAMEYLVSNTTKIQTPVLQKRRDEQRANWKRIRISEPQYSKATHRGTSY